MQKNNYIKNFIIGGCIGITLIIISYIVTNLFMGNISQDVLNMIKIFSLSYAVGGVYFSMVKASINKIENKDIKSKSRQSLLIIQLKAISAIIGYFFILLIVFIINNNSINIIITLCFMIAFGLWDYGCMLAYLNLKNNMAMINKKKF